MTDAGMRITVRRTGGFAGMSRQWSASVDPEEPPWHELLERLPWQETGQDDDGVDRFIYVVTCEPVSASNPELRCEVPERRFTGPWQELLDRVRGTSENTG